MSGPPFFTIGHSNRELAEFTDLLLENEIEQVVDVRRLPGSARNPQFNADSLAESLLQQEIRLDRLESLTGRRPVSRTVPFEVNAWWQNRSFHNYADHAVSREFADGLRTLREWGALRRTAVLCSEAVWWRCHRRIIADHLLPRGEAVQHILGPGRAEVARLSEGAVVADEIPRYPAD